MSGPKILAAGPYFADPQHPSAQRRVILAKTNRSQRTGTGFEVLIERRTAGKVCLKSTGMKAGQFTLAARLFCDCLLDEALAADVDEQERMARRAC
jgi:hypothetical protein